MVLDASPLVAIFGREKGFELLQEKINAADRVLIGAPTLFETAMVLSRISGGDQSPVLENYLRRMKVEIVPFTSDHYVAAVKAFERYGRGRNPKSKLNFGDCLTYAVAKLADDSLLFTGFDFLYTDIVAA